MNEYTSCFLGISLPDKHQQDFERLLMDISRTDPFLEVIYPKTPHITEYYLDEQSQFDLANISEKVKSKLDLLKGIELTVGGFGTFGGNAPKVLFLNIQYPEVLKIFREVVAGDLVDYYASDNDLPFYPHMTVARIRTPEAQQSFRQAQVEMKSRLDEVRWTFPLTEVVLYGVDSTKNPQYQQKLIHIPV